MQAAVKNMRKNLAVSKESAIFLVLCVDFQGLILGYVK